MTLGEKLKTLRKNKNITQEGLAKELRVDRSTIAKWETNGAVPDIATVKRIAEYYEVSISNLVDDEQGITEKKTDGIEVFAAYRTDDQLKDLPPEALAELETLKQYILSKYKKDK